MSPRSKQAAFEVLPPERAAREMEEELLALWKDEDIFGAFLDEECVVNPELRAKSALLWKRYEAWTEGSGKDSLSQRKFGSTLAERGFKRFTNDGTWYRGLGLRQNDRVSDD